MKILDAVKELDGIEMRDLNEKTELFQAMSESGLVVAFGQSTVRVLCSQLTALNQQAF